MRDVVVLPHTSDDLGYCTTRIRVPTTDGEEVGSGFFMALGQMAAQHVPVVITNKHVIDGGPTAYLTISKRQPDGSRGKAPHAEVAVPTTGPLVVRHPDPEVDLVAIVVGGAFNGLRSSGVHPHFRNLDLASIPSEAQIKDLLGIEQVVMVGYPIGLWDQANNLPLFRRGITASRLDAHWEGRPHFLIDAACFPGSSGSPVFVYDQGVYATRDGAVAGTRVMLAGVLFGGPEMDRTGVLSVRKLPTRPRTFEFSVPTNLGLCIHAREIVVLDAILRAAFGIGAPEPAAGGKPPL